MTIWQMTYLDLHKAFVKDCQWKIKNEDQNILLSASFFTEHLHESPNLSILTFIEFLRFSANLPKIKIVDMSGFKERQCTSIVVLKDLYICVSSTYICIEADKIESSWFWDKTNNWFI